MSTTLSIDIGGTGIKAALVGPDGRIQGQKVRLDTPVGAHPDAVMAAIASLVQPLGEFTRVAVGFPGVVRGGRTHSAANLGHDAWRGYELEARLAQLLGKVVRSANDADMQGLAVISGQGVELVVTLGTGFGTGIYQDGKLGPHLELAHHPFRKGETYEQQLGNEARQRVGNKRWNRRLGKAIATLRALTSFDHLYLGGGNAKKVRLDLPPDVTLVDNVAGIAGGARLW